LDRQEKSIFIYEAKREYYESLRPIKTPVSWFAGDLMHYIFAESFVNDKKVLDAGSGLGYGAYYLSASGAKEVIGIDISMKNIEEASARFDNANLCFSPMDITKMSFDDKAFDIITNFEVLEHIPYSSINLFMKEVMRVLKDDGKFIISTPNKDVYSFGSKISKTMGHINELSAKEFTELMKKYFKKCEFYYQLKYDKQELNIRREKQSRLEVASKQLSWRSIIPKPIKKVIKRVLKSEMLDPNDSDLIEQMQIWSVKAVDTIEDLDLSVIQIAICETPKPSIE
jgi:2-polyprenyl-3-methyl-5-hydroxy-6-metoxy-1,4-benzoquinol methylase